MAVQTNSASTSQSISDLKIEVGCLELDVRKQLIYGQRLRLGKR